MRRLLLTGLALLLATPLHAGGGKVIVESARTGGLATRDGALTIGRTTRDFCTDGVRGATRDLVGGLFIATYPCFLAGFVALMLAEDDGHLWVFLFIMVTVASDIGGYAAGVLFGRHPMAPTVSPKKSWEGFAGSVAFCALVGAVALHLMLDGS